jgi:hypothetical protein
VRQCGSCRMDCEVATPKGRREFGYYEERICWEEAEGVAGGNNAGLECVLVSRGDADKNVEFAWVPPLERAVEG